MSSKTIQINTLVSNCIRHISRTVLIIGVMAESGVILEGSRDAIWLSLLLLTLLAQTRRLEETFGFWISILISRIISLVTLVWTTSTVFSILKKFKFFKETPAQIMKVFTSQCLLKQALNGMIWLLLRQGASE